MWSLGVALYALLAGRLPFHHPAPARMAELVAAGRFDPLPPEVSPACVSLVRAMLAPDPRRRATLPALLAHPWVAAAAVAGAAARGAGGWEAVGGRGEAAAMEAMAAAGFDAARARDEAARGLRNAATVCYRLLLLSPSGSAGLRPGGIVDVPG